MHQDGRKKTSFEIMDISGIIPHDKLVDIVPGYSRDTDKVLSAFLCTLVQ